MYNGRDASMDAFSYLLGLQSHLLISCTSQLQAIGGENHYFNWKLTSLYRIPAFAWKGRYEYEQTVALIHFPALIQNPTEIVSALEHWVGYLASQCDTWRYVRVWGPCISSSIRCWVESHTVMPVLMWRVKDEMEGSPVQRDSEETEARWGKGYHMKSNLQVIQIEVLEFFCGCQVAPICATRISPRAGLKPFGRWLHPPQ
jgi:hypothetical protein